MNAVGETPRPPQKHLVVDARKVVESGSKAPSLDLLLVKTDDVIDLTCGSVDPAEQRGQKLTVITPPCIDLACYDLRPTEAIVQVGDGNVIDPQLRDRQIVIVGSTPGGSLLMQGAITAVHLVEYCDPDQRTDRYHTPPVLSTALARNGTYLTQEQLTHFEPNNDNQRFDSLSDQFGQMVIVLNKLFPDSKFINAEFGGFSVHASCTLNTDSQIDDISIFDPKTATWIRIIIQRGSRVGEKFYRLETLTGVDPKKNPFSMSHPIEGAKTRYVHLVSNGELDGSCGTWLDHDQVAQIEPDQSSFVSCNPDGSIRYDDNMNPAARKKVVVNAFDSELNIVTPTGTVAFPRQPDFNLLSRALDAAKSPPQGNFTRLMKRLNRQ